MNYKKINLLDCTLRDGGYYNNWNFKHNLIKEYLILMSKLQIKYSLICSLDIKIKYSLIKLCLSCKLSILNLALFLLHQN